MLPLVPGSLLGPEGPELEPCCHWVDAAALQTTIPAGLRSLKESERARMLAQLVESERLFFSDAPEQGQKAMGLVWEALERRPEYLPAEAKDRSVAYRVLVTWMRLQPADSAVRGGLADWLACHMPDQEPSVRNMPMEEEVLAARAVERARRSSVMLEAESALGCEATAILFMDGVEVGKLPLHGVPIPMGNHSFWAECGEKRSWVRVRSVTAAMKLSAFDMTKEGLLSLDEGTPVWDPAKEAGAHTDLLRAVASWSGVGAVAVPDLSNQAVWVASPARAFRMDVVAGEPLELADRLEEDWTLLWLAGGAAMTSAAMLGGGVWATQKHNDLVAEMNVGTVDHREAIADWADGATAMYVSAGALAVAAVGLWLVDWVMTPAEAEPLFRE